MDVAAPVCLLQDAAALCFSSDSVPFQRLADGVDDEANLPELPGVDDVVAYWDSAARGVAAAVSGSRPGTGKIVVKKSVVPIKTAEAMERILQRVPGPVQSGVLLRGTTVRDLLCPELRCPQQELLARVLGWRRRRLLLAHMAASAWSTNKILELAVGCGRQDAAGADGHVSARDAYEAIDGAHGLCVLTYCDEFKTLDYCRVFDGMMRPAFVFHGRNVVNAWELREISFVVYAVGGRARI